MGKIIGSIKKSKFLRHETKRYALRKFLLILLIVVGYFVFVSLKFGIENGLWVTILTWSFFVFCTPIADAGFLFDFPIRLTTGIRMFHSEIGVWIFAAILNIFTLKFNPEIYQKTIVLKLFHYIIVHPFPYWLITVLSAIGTYLSIYFGDELIDVARHRNRSKYFRHRGKHEFVIFLFLIVLTIILYNFLLERLGINIIHWI